MKISTKAALLSAFAYPGAGQIYLKCHAVAIALIVVATVAFLMAIVPLFGVATELASRIESGEMALGPEMFGELYGSVDEATGLSTGPGMVLLAAWVTGIAHAWWEGRSRGTLPVN